MGSVFDCVGELGQLFVTADDPVFVGKVLNPKQILIREYRIGVAKEGCRVGHTRCIITVGYESSPPRCLCKYSLDFMGRCERTKEQLYSSPLER